MKDDDIKKNSRLTYNLAAQEIIYAQDEEYKCVDFYGGEPTCFSFLNKALKLTNSLGMEATLATNAIRFYSKEYTKNLFSNISIKGIRTSLHSCNSKIHDKITQVPGSFNKTIEGIKNILKYNRCLTINIVITVLNYSDIVEIVHCVHRLGVRGVKFSRSAWEGKMSYNRWLDIDSTLFLPYLRQALNTARKLNFQLIEVERIPRHFLKSKQFNFVCFLSEISSKIITAGKY